MTNMTEVFRQKLDHMRRAAPQASIRLLVGGGSYYAYDEDAVRAHKASPQLVVLKLFENYSDKTDDWGDPLPAGPPATHGEILVANVWAFIEAALAQGHTIALVDVAMANRRDAARHHMVALFEPAHVIASRRADAEEDYIIGLRKNKDEPEPWEW